MFIKIAIHSLTLGRQANIALCGQFGDSSLKNIISWDIFELPNTVGIDPLSLRNTVKRDEP